MRLQSFIKNSSSFKKFYLKIKKYNPHKNKKISSLKEILITRSLSFSIAAGFSTMYANETYWLLGFKGPVPPPLLISFYSFIILFI
jgi:hypothetical protein